MPGMGHTLQSDNPTVVSAFHTALCTSCCCCSSCWRSCGHLQRDADDPVPATAAAGRTAFPAPPALGPSRRPGGSSASASAASGSSTGCSSCSRPCRSVCRRRVSSRPPPPRRTGCSTSSTAASPSGPTTRSRPPRQPSGSSSGSASGSSSRPAGRWSRLAGLASAGWGLVVWVFGEAFGGIFAPGATWLFGAPGAVLFYCVAGVLIALPERAFATPRLGRIVLGVGRRLPHRHGRPAGVARAGFLAGRPPRHPARHGPPDGADAPAGVLSSWFASFGSLRRRARVGGQPVRRRRPGASSARCSADRAAPVRPRRPRRPRRALPRGLGARRGPRLPRRRRAPTRTPCCPWPCSSWRATWPWSGCPARSRGAGRPATECQRRRRRRPLVGARDACRTCVRDRRRRRRARRRARRHRARWRWPPSTRTPTRS